MRIRDDVVRDLVLQAEEAPAGQSVKLESEELDKDGLNYYIQYLRDRKVLDAQITKSEKGKIVHVVVNGLTPTGHQLAVGGNSIEAIYEDRAGALWIGLGAFDPAREAAVARRASGADAVVGCAARSDLWSCTGLMVFPEDCHGSIHVRPGEGTLSLAQQP